MKERTFEEWVEYYERRECRFRLERHETLEWHPDHGFLVWYYYPEKNAIQVTKVCGDGKYWAKRIAELVKEHGCQQALAFTTRNPEAFTRFFGGHVYGYHIAFPLEEGEEKWLK